MERTFYPKEILLFFDEVCREIKDSIDPDFILIAGSFGKKSWLYAGSELISDFELVFICKKSWSLKNKARLLQRLNANYPYEISLKGYLSKNVSNKVISNYSSKNPGYISLDFFDTFSNPVILYNKNNEDINVKCDVNDIPIWEAWRLYVNRMGDLLSLEPHESVDEINKNYFWLKIFESTAGAYCIINKIYNKNISKRLEVFDKELIDNDIELDDICKNSFRIIRLALLAREQHDLALFNVHLTCKERKEIVTSWMQYFEKKLAIAEQIYAANTIEFQNNYLNNKKLQKKYLGFNYYFNKFVSNSIRLSYNMKLVNFNFNFFNHKYSYRHIVLLSVSSLFYELSNDSRDFSQTKKIMNKIASSRKMSDDGLIKNVLKYWRILR